MSRPIDVSDATAASLETMADALGMEPASVVEEIVGLAAAHPELLEQWLDGQRFRPGDAP